MADKVANEEKVLQPQEDTSKTKEDKTNPEQLSNDKSEEKVEEKTLEQEVMEVKDKQYQAKVIADLQKDIVEMKTMLLASLKNNKEQSLIDSKAVGEIKQPTRQTSSLDEIMSSISKRKN